MSELQISRFGLDRLDDVEPLRNAMHVHHVEVAPVAGMFGPVDDIDVRRQRDRCSTPSR